MAVQDFIMQKESELEADYLRRLKRSFQLAYGRDNLKSETKETMLIEEFSCVRLFNLQGALCSCKARGEQTWLTQHYHQGIKNSQPKLLDSRTLRSRRSRRVTL